MELLEAVEIIKSNMESEPVRELLQPITDRAVSKGIETFKKNTLPDLIKQSTAEPESPAEIELKRLQADLEKMKADSERKEFETQVLTYGMKAGLPEAVCRNLAIDNFDTAKGLIDTLQAQIKSVIETKNIQAANGPTPLKGGNMQTFNLERIGSMSADDIYKNLTTLTK